MACRWDYQRRRRINGKRRIETALTVGYPTDYLFLFATQHLFSLTNKPLVAFIYDIIYDNSFHFRKNLTLLLLFLPIGWYLRFIISQKTVWLWCAHLLYVSFVCTLHPKMTVWKDICYLIYTHSALKTHVCVFVKAQLVNCIMHACLFVFCFFWYHLHVKIFWHGVIFPFIHFTFFPFSKISSFSHTHTTTWPTCTVNKIYLYTLYHVLLTLNKLTTMIYTYIHTKPPRNLHLTSPHHSHYRPNTFPHPSILIHPFSSTRFPPPPPPSFLHHKTGKSRHNTIQFLFFTSSNFQPSFPQSIILTTSHSHDIIRVLPTYGTSVVIVPAATTN